MAKPLLKFDSHLTLRERIVETVRDAIIRGNLKPGERVAESEVARSLGISRTPIREAFRQLESEGFLTVVPRKGAVVSSFSEKDIEEFYDLKALLEGEAARLAQPRMGAREIGRLKELNETMRSAAVRGDARAVFRAHNDFHLTFVDLCGNDKLRDLIHQLMSQFARFRYLLSVKGEIADSLRQHEEIIAAFETGDALKVSGLVRENARTGAQNIRDKILRAPAADAPERRAATASTP